MTRLPGSETRSSGQQALDSIKRWRRRNRAIRELRAMDRWRLADLGLSRDQIPALVDAMLAKRDHSGARIVPTEVQATRTGWMLGPWADGLAGP